MTDSPFPCDLHEPADENRDARLAELEAQNAALKARNAGLEAEKAKLEAQNVGLEAQNAALEGEKAELEAQNAALEAEQAKLKARVAELERAVGLNSGNSHMPSSQDKPHKKPKRARSLRQRSGKASGGQPGHSGETLKPVSNPDRVVDHYPKACSGCGAPLKPEMSVGYQARQVFDLPETQPEVTEHRAHECQCAACGAKTRATFPEDVTAPVQYGPRIKAFVVYLSHYQLLPEQRLAELMADLFGVPLAASTIANISRACAIRFQGFVSAVRDRVCAAPVKHLDETGFRIGKKSCWLHVASTPLLTFYRCCQLQGDTLETLKRGDMPENLTGIVVHDHWKSYDTLQGVEHALCNAHHLRELQGLIEHDNEDWAKRMQVLLRRACHAVNLARDHDKTLPPRLIELINRRYDAITADGLAFHEAQEPLPRKKRGRQPRRAGHNLLGRLQARKHEVLRFLTNPAVPFTNNQAERDLRMMKVRQKISGGFRSNQGADDFSTMRSAISTAKKQGWNIIKTLIAKPASLIAQIIGA